MEGVVVTAWKEGSTISVSVVTDSTGCYTFPESKLDGDFALKILAVGDEFVGPRAVHVRRTLELIHLKDARRRYAEPDAAAGVAALDDSLRT